MKREDITQYTIGTYIREQRIAGVKEIVWNKEEWDVLNAFLHDVVTYLGEFTFESGDMWQGVIHKKA